MNKLITKVVGVSLGLVMALGVGVAVGASRSEVVPVHAATSTDSFNTYASSSFTESNSVYTASGDVASLALEKNETSATAWRSSDSDHVRVYAKWKGTVTAGGNAISEITFNVKSGYADDLDGATWTNVSSKTGGTTTSTSLVVTPTLNATSVVFVLTAQTRITSVSVTYGEASTDTYTVSFNGNGASGTMADVDDVSGSYTLPANGFTVPSGQMFTGWKANNSGDLLLAGASYNVTEDVTFYAQWVNVYNVTYTAGSNGSGSYVHSNQQAGTYTLLPFESLTGVSASTGYKFKNYSVGGVDKDPGDTITLSAATFVTVVFEEKGLETTYDFTTNFSTYASSWSGYGTHEGLDGVNDIGGDYDATIDLYYASKQTNTINDRPVFASKTASGSYTQVLKFTLNESGYKIKAITVTFAQWGSKTPSAALYKGATASGTALDTATIGTKNTLTVSSLNDTIFSIGYSDGNTSSNVQAGLTSIYITLEAQAAYGTTDHIKVTGMPRTVYHIGEKYDSTGLAVTAYDGADESTANFKDVTAEVSTRFTHNVYTFDDTDVPSTDMWIEYTESGTVFSPESDITIYVYVLAEYELVSSEPTDWSGNYLIVSTDSESNLIAMNGGLTNPDVEANYQVVTEKSTGIIEAGQENEWTISAVSGGYSIQGKSNKYIGRTTGSNGMNVSDSAIANTLSFSSGDVTIAGSGSGASYQLTFNTTGNRFRYYGSGTVQLYKLVESDNADAYAQTFLGAITCDATGATAPTFTIKEGSTYWSWSLLATEYDTLTAAEKEQFRTGVASESGSNIEKALAKYDYIVAKYGTGSYSNFMNRTITPLSSSRILLNNVLGSNGGAVSVIVIVSLVSLTAIGGYFFTRKRKEQ